MALVASHASWNHLEFLVIHWHEKSDAQQRDQLREDGKLDRIFPADAEKSLRQYGPRRA